jgi:hypothetical protein
MLRTLPSFETVYVAVIEIEYVNMGVVASEGNKRRGKQRGSRYSRTNKLSIRISNCSLIVVV